MGLALLLSFLLFLTVGSREQSALFRGDFPAFYVAAEIVHSGRAARLYDYSLQRELENSYWPDFGGTFLVFPYPPFFALILSPLAALPPLTAKAVAAGFLLAFLFGSLFITRPISAFVRTHFLFVVFYILTLPPVAISIVGGQNTALSILCFALVQYGIKSQHRWLTGFAAALLLYKPQFGGLLFLYLLGRRDKRELAGWGIGASALYLLGAWALGVNWPILWLQAAHHFGEINFVINDYNMISFVGLVYWVFETSLGAGSQALLWAYVCSAIIILVSIVYVVRDAQRFALVPYLVLLLSPQTLFYDIGIAAFCFVRDLVPYNIPDFKLLGVIWFCSAVGLLVRGSASPLLFVFLLSAMLWIHSKRIDARLFAAS